MLTTGEHLGDSLSNMWRDTMGVVIDVCVPIAVVFQDVRSGTFEIRWNWFLRLYQLDDIVIVLEGGPERYRITI